MESTLNDLKTRHSVRKFKDEVVSKDDLEKILETATYAPTGLGLQSPKILVIQRKDIIERIEKWDLSYFPDDIKKELEEDYDPFFKTSTLIIVLANSEIPTCVEDGSLVIGNILNAAHAIGVGGCWIHRAREEFDSLQGKELLKVWGIPEKYIGIGHVILGYPADDFEPKITPRKDDYIVYLDDLL